MWVKKTGLWLTLYSMFNWPFLFSFLPLFSPQSVFPGVKQSCWTLSSPVSSQREPQTEAVLQNCKCDVKILTCHYGFVPKTIFSTYCNVLFVKKIQVKKQTKHLKTDLFGGKRIFISCKYFLWLVALLCKPDWVWAFYFHYQKHLSFFWLFVLYVNWVAFVPKKIILL